MWRIIWKRKYFKSMQRLPKDWTNIAAEMNRKWYTSNFEIYCSHNLQRTGKKKPELNYEMEKFLPSPPHKRILIYQWKKGVGECACP